MNLIVAVDKNFAIGNNGKLLCYLKPDLEYFKSLTLNKTVIMGRKTLVSLPNSKPLKMRKNIVLTTNKNFICEDAIICYSVDEVLKKLNGIPKEDIFVIGGETIYKQFLPYCDTAYVTKINQKFSADTFIPNFDKLTDWKLVFCSKRMENNNISFYFTKYIRIKD